MNIQERYQKKTPKFFKKLRNIGIAIAAGGGALLSAPVTLPTAIASIATYMVVVGSTVSAVSQAVVTDPDDSGEVNRTSSESIDQHENSA